MPNGAVYLATAKRLGIPAGVGNNMRAPGNQITRQEMFTLLYNALKAIVSFLQVIPARRFASFTDAGGPVSITPSVHNYTYGG